MSLTDYRFTISAALAALLLTAGCGDDDPGDLQQPGPEVAAVTVSAPDSEIEIGQTVQLTATALDAGGAVLADRSFEWTSDDPAVAAVSPTGLVTGTSGGSAEISATADDVTGVVTITVLPPEPGPPTVPPPGEPPPTPAPPPPPGSGNVGLEPVAGGMQFPLGLTSPPGDPRLFIANKGGAIRVVKDGAVLDEPFLDLTGMVGTRREQGLLGLAFPSDYATSGRFVVHYSDLAGDTRISTFAVSPDPDRADPASESVVLTAAQPGPAHNGGQILFGPDGLLYIALGDGSSSDGDDGGRGQSLNDLLGSILRIDVSSGSGYTVPADNPFVTTAGARPEIWSYGLRNPWRFSFDRGTGDIYVADVGELRWEEVNYSAAAAGAGRGLNYGWSRMEGAHCYAGTSCDQSGLTPPIFEYSHAAGCTIIGGYVYRGTAIPALQGHYLYADLCEGWVRSIRIEGGAVVEEADWPDLRPGGFVTSFGEDAAGELYVMTEQGGLFKIVPR